MYAPRHAHTRAKAHTHTHTPRHTHTLDSGSVLTCTVWLLSVLLLWITMEFTMMTCNDPLVPVSECSGSSSGFESTRGVLRVFRIVRIFRIVIIINKIKRSRENAQIMRKKAKYKRQGSPVERVIEILQRLRRKMESAADRENLAFITDAIISDQLYKVNVSAADSSGMTTEMSAFLLEGGAETNKAKKLNPVGKVLTKVGTGVGAKGAKGKRATIKAPGDPLSGETAATVSSTNKSPSGARADGSANGRPPPNADGSPARAPPEERKSRRESITSGLTKDLAWVEALQAQPEVQAAMKDVDSWDFNVFELERVSGHHPILLIVLHTIQRFELDQALPINMENLIRLLVKVEQGYHGVPFHNHVHAADVTHGSAYFLSQDVVSRHVSPLDIYCIVIGAALHDYGHPGFNNAFLVASRHEHAITYNDVSVLENFHISSSWRLVLNDETNPFQGFSDEQYQEARQTMVYAVLGTDMKFHFDHLTKFKTRLGAGAFDDPDRKDVRLLLAMCLHSADVSNPAKRWELSVEWAARVMEEFFQQGEEEARLGLPVSPFMDRQKTDIGQCQAGFISILIKPFFDEWTLFLGDSNRHIFENIESNIKTWKEQGEGALGERAAALKKVPPPRPPPK